MNSKATNSAVRARSLKWDRQIVLEELRDRLWRYVSPSSTSEQLQYYAKAALQMSLRDVRTLGMVQFLTSDEVGRLVRELPWLIRRLTTATERFEEISTERVRGSIRWGKTYAARAASGLPHVYVTAPAERVYSTPENQILVFVLDAISRASRQVGWYRSEAEDWGREVSRRVAEAEKWRQVRMLDEVEVVVPTSRDANDVRIGRSRRTYAAAIAAYDLYQRLVGRLDDKEVRRAVEEHALATRNNPILLELLVWFRTLECLKSDLALQMETVGLVRGGLSVKGYHKNGRSITAWYQQAPPALASKSRYIEVSRRHRVSIGPKRPDFVLRVNAPDLPDRWLVGEVKLYRAVEKGARAALTDLLAYRRDFTTVLDDQVQKPYGLGVVWGQRLSPGTAEHLPEVLLCSPDQLSRTLQVLLSAKLTRASSPGVSNG